MEELKVVDSSLSESESSSDDNTFSSYDSSVDSREFRWTYKLHQKQEHLNQLVLNQRSTRAQPLMKWSQLANDVLLKPIL